MVTKPTIPRGLKERLVEMFGVSLASDLERFFRARPTTLRINTLRGDRATILTELTAAGFKLKNVSWYREAFVLQNKSQRELESTPAYLFGRIYVQSLASMVPPLILAPQPGEKVLDMTAAPGGKTSQLAALMNGQGKLVAAELDSIRYARLEHNLRLLGVAEKLDFLELFLGDAKRLVDKYSEYFDRILLDAPCSAEARINLEDRASFGYWNEKKIAATAKEQRRLLAAGWDMLRPGGFLVYSTCTFAPEENEVQIAGFLVAHS